MKTSTAICNIPGNKTLNTIGVKNYEMKKFGLIFSFLLLSAVTVAQIQEEDFSQDHLPNGWQSSAIDGNVEWQFG